MFTSLSDALSENSETALFYENYQRQCVLYESLLDTSKNESDLVCGRCLIALSRSLTADEIKKESVCAAKNELDILKDVFLDGARPSKRQIERLVRSRVELLSTSDSDAVYDAVLFLYLSLR